MRQFSRSALAFGMTSIFACAGPVQPGGPRPPKLSQEAEVSTLQVDLRAIASITVLTVETDDLATPRRLARCGPGLYWSASKRGIADLSEQRLYELPIASAELSSVDCPASGGVVMSFMDGLVVFASDVSFTKVARLSTDLGAPVIAVGPRDELWLWQQDGKEVHQFHGSAHRRLAMRYGVSAVASAGPLSAVVALRDGTLSRIVLVGAEADGSMRIDEIGRVEGDVAGLAVGAGGRLYVSGPSCLAELTAEGSHRCVADVPAGSLSAFGDELTLLPRDGDRLFVFGMKRP